MNIMVEHEDKCLPTQTPLIDTWTLWAHLPHDTNWDFNSYHEITDIKTIEDALTIYENIPEIVIKNCMLFLMRKGIQPIWEDEKNRNGGCFSYKINNKNIYNCWKNLSYVLLGETLTDSDISKYLNGITVSPKKNFCIFKIWLNTCKFNNPDIIKDIEGLTKQGCIFKKHIQ
tara:strand:- start:829 stop:1344 length:516 start_codon:yes stop_codon:yes gene_type:complete